MSTICGQLKLYAADGKKYLSDVINEEGQMYGYTVDDNFSGVRPAITINFNIN